MNDSCTYCQPCFNLNKFEDWVYWCMNCQELLCGGCYDYHKILTITKDHRVLKKDDYFEIFQFLSSIEKNCEKHPENKVEYFCFYHEVVCCLTCKRNTHNSCEVEKLNPTEPMIHTDTGYDQLISSSESLQLSINTLTELCDIKSKNIDKINKQRARFMDDVQVKKVEMYAAIDKLETSLKSKFELGYQIERQKLEAEQKSLSEIIENLREKRKQLAKVVDLKVLSKDQLCLAKHSMCIEAKKQEDATKKYLQMCSDISCEFDITLKMDSSYRSFTIIHDLSFISRELSTDNNENKNRIVITNESDTTAPALTIDDDDNKENNNRTIVSNVDVETVDSSTVEADEMLETKHLKKIRVPVEKNSENDPTHQNDQMLMETNLQSTQIEDELANYFKIPKVSFQYLRHFKVREKGKDTVIKCLKLLMNGNIIIGEAIDPRLIVFEKSGLKLREIKLKDIPESIAVIDRNRTAVTVDNSVLIVSSKNLKMVGKCFGIVFNGEHLFIGCKGKGLLVMSLSGQILKSFKTLKNVFNLTLINTSTIACINSDSKELHCVNVETDDVMTSECYGISSVTDITSDHQNNIYVASIMSSKIHMLKCGTSQWVTLLDSKDKIERPIRLEFYHKTNSLYIINNEGKTLYTFQKQLK